MISEGIEKLREIVGKSIRITQLTGSCNRKTLYDVGGKIEERDKPPAERRHTGFCDCISQKNPVRFRAPLLEYFHTTPPQFTGKEATMARESLTFKTIAEVDHGSVEVAMDEALLAAYRDMLDRPGLKTDRKGS